MAETKRADEIVPGDVVAFGRSRRFGVVELPESERARQKPKGTTVLCLQADDHLTVFELADHAEAEKLADGSWWF